MVKVNEVQQQMVRSRSKMLSRMVYDGGTKANIYGNLPKIMFPKVGIRSLMPYETRKNHFLKERIRVGTKAIETAREGCIIGGFLGGVVGIIAAYVTSLTNPELGLIIADTLTAGLAGTIAGSAMGGIIGGLVGSGMPKRTRQVY